MFLKWNDILIKVERVLLSGTLAPEVRDNGDGTYDVTYVPPSEGSNVKAKITWDGKDIPNRYGFKLHTIASYEK